jgi:iron complex transport system substrate-binding protein
VRDTAVQVPADGIKIRIPITSIAATSCTYYEFLALLGEIESIAGICNPNLTYNVFVRERLTAGKIADLGDNFNMNLEKLFAIHPDIVMVSGYEKDDKYSKMVGKSGIPVAYNQEWNETTLLGRAEWIKFIAAFYDKSALADSLFADIESRYLVIAAKAQSQERKPRILSGGDFRGTWYLPGGQSFMAKMYKDAGGSYFYSDDKHKSSLSFTFEAVLVRFIVADYWLGAPCNTLTELKQTDGRYSYFTAFKKGRVYHFNKRCTPTGGNDFWESAVARPDVVLADVIKILHPELLSDHELVYTEKLGE